MAETCSCGCGRQVVTVERPTEAEPCNCGCCTPEQGKPVEERQAV